MSRQTDINKRVNKTLESLDRIQRAEPIPYFFTRVRARLERDEKNVWEVMGKFLARPVVAFAGLTLILGLNALIVFEKGSAVEPAGYYISQNTEEEYALTAATNASYDYENIEP